MTPNFLDPSNTQHQLELAIRLWAREAKPIPSLLFDLATESLHPSLRRKISYLTRFTPDGWQRYRDTDPKRTAAEIERLCDQLQNVLDCLTDDKLHEWALYALIKSGAGFAEYDDFGDAPRVMRSFLNKASEAFKNVKADVPRRGRPRKSRESVVTDLTSDIFQFLTGSEATTIVGEPSGRHSPFIDLLGRVFNCLSIDAKASSMAANGIRRRGVRKK